MATKFAASKNAFFAGLMVAILIGVLALALFKAIDVVTSAAEPLAKALGRSGEVISLLAVVAPELVAEIEGSTLPVAGVAAGGESSRGERGDHGFESHSVSVCQAAAAVPRLWVLWSAAPRPRKIHDRILSEFRASRCASPQVAVE